MIFALLVSMSINAESGNPYPDISTAHQLLNACDTTPSSPDSYPDFGDFMADWTARNACHYYVGGFLDGQAANSSLIDTNAPLYCAPATGISTEMVTAALGNYLSQHPENMNDSARVVLAVTLRHFFECK